MVFHRRITSRINRERLFQKLSKREKSILGRRDEEEKETVGAEGAGKKRAASSGPLLFISD
jgi:hypothetical protein